MIQNNTPGFLGHLPWCVWAMVSLRKHTQWGYTRAATQISFPLIPQAEAMRLGRRWKTPSLWFKVHLGWALWEFSAPISYWWQEPLLEPQAAWKGWTWVPRTHGGLAPVQGGKATSQSLASLSSQQLVSSESWRAAPVFGVVLGSSASCSFIVAAASAMISW